MKKRKGFGRSGEGGQSAAEYAIILALLVIIAMVGVGALGSSTKDGLYENIVDKMP